MDIFSIFATFAKNFEADRSRSFGKTENTILLTENAPEVIRTSLQLDSNYKVYGSVGTGNWAEIPWVAILDKSITSSTQSGYYVVFLFDKRLSSIYLSLALGYTQFEVEFGVKDAREKIQGTAKHYGAQLEKEGFENFKRGRINLFAENNLGKGYELGTVISKRYVLSEPSNSIMKELELMLLIYKELKETVGDSVLNIEIDTEQYDEAVKTFRKDIAKSTFKEINKSSLLALIEKTENQPRQIRERLIKQIVRNKKIAEYVKALDNFKCVICKLEPFTQSNGKPYAEADHIIPLNGKEKGEDIINNMRCLCAQCHRIVTYGSHTELYNLFRKNNYSQD